MPPRARSGPPMLPPTGPPMLLPAVPVKTEAGAVLIKTEAGAAVIKAEADAVASPALPTVGAVVLAIEPPRMGRLGPAPQLVAAAAAAAPPAAAPPAAAPAPEGQPVVFVNSRHFDSRGRMALIRAMLGLKLDGFDKPCEVSFLPLLIFTSPPATSAYSCSADGRNIGSNLRHDPQGQRRQLV
jgi:hypothetical protein